MLVSILLLHSAVAHGEGAQQRKLLFGATQIGTDEGFGPDVLFRDDFDAIDPAIWTHTQDAYFIADGALRALGTGGIGQGDICQTLQSFDAPITVEMEIMKVGKFLAPAGCAMMQVLAQGGISRHSAIDYCGGCWGKECISRISGGCSGHDTTTSIAGFEHGTYYKVRVTVAEDGQTINLYSDFGNGWMHTDFGTSSSVYSSGKIAFNEQCDDVGINYVWVKSGVHAPTTLTD